MGVRENWIRPRVPSTATCGQAARELGLAEGAAVTAIIKASDVILGVADD